MIKRSIVFAVFVLLVAIAWGAASRTIFSAPTVSEVTAKKAAPEKPSLFGEFAHEFASAFNRADARAAAALWSAKGVHVDRGTGDRSSGREAIEKVYTELFKQRERGEMTLSIDEVREIKPDVAKVVGTVTILHADGEATESRITALMVKEDGKWLIDSVEESAVPAPITPYDHLQSLAWMVGSWHDASDGIEVKTTCRWSANRTFLSRHYSVLEKGELTHQGLQIIGWDPEKLQIRSWKFEADGSFGEGIWKQDGNQWTTKIHAILPNGGHATATQIIQKLDDNKYTTQLIGRENDGELLPKGTVIKVSRDSGD
jgi:uncharacterized protein (TIGR02246 family)